MIAKEEIGGAVGTIIFFVLLLLILLFSYFTIASPPQELEGIPVMLGTEENAGGSTEPNMSQSSPQPTPSVPDYAPEQPLITQTEEPTINVNAQREEEERRQRLAAEQQRIQQEREAADRKRREEEAKARAISQQMSGLFGENNTGSRGNTEGTGTQGVSTGNSTQGSPTGNGGIGTYDLGGRSVGSGGLVQPRYNVNEDGTVVVNITVAPNGSVINAEIGRGTNTPSTALRNESLRAARNTKFQAVTHTNNQQGTITYKFSLK